MEKGIGWALLCVAGVVGVAGGVAGWPLTLPSVAVLFLFGGMMLTDHERPVSLVEDERRS